MVRAALLATILLVLLVALGLVGLAACETPQGHAIAILGCKTQCPILHTATVDACDGKLDGKATAKPGNSLYALCIQEADLVSAGCPAACEQIPGPDPAG